MATATEAPKAPAGNGPVNVGFLLDNTGSMMTRRDEAIQGFNKYVKDLQEVSNEDYRLMLVTFNSERTKMVTDGLAPVRQVQPLSLDTYVPAGFTPLLDATAAIIRDLESRGASRRTLVVILTDGEENYSKEYDFKELGELVTKKQDVDGWSFIFLGADMDAWQIGARMGISIANTVAYTGSAMGQTIGNLSAGTQNYARATSPGGQSVNSGGFVSSVKGGLIDKDDPKWKAVINKNKDKKA